MSTAHDDLIARLQKLYLEGDIDGVAVVAVDSTRCDACAQFDGQMYTPSTLPLVPVPGCTRTSGCRCRYEANFTVYE
ncbi:MAG: hypothetical protein ABIP53_10700 [Candidatus Limnocylindrales bacterium]